MSARRGIVLVLALILLATAVSVGALVLLSLAGGAPPTVPSNSTLYLRLQPPFGEVEPSDVFSQFVRPKPTLRETVDTIRKAKGDARIKTLVIVPEADGALWAQVQEVRKALQDFRTSGKAVVAFMESGGAQAYYVASAADRIVMMPAGQLDVSGLAYYEIFLRGAFDKMGVYPDMLHIGDYKTASNTFTEKTFTPAHREMTQALNRSWYDELVRAIAQGRKVSEQAARAAIDGGPYTADGAVKAGLVDELAYEDQLDDKSPIQGTSRFEGENYVNAMVSGSRRESGGRVALLYAAGTIASGKSSYDSPGGPVVGSETFVQWLRKVRVDPSIKAIVIRVDSPGGSAIASEVIWREVMLARDVKPVVVSMGDVAASGGYYIAAPAHTIVAQPGTLTGSIGVVTGKFVLEGALEKLGVGTESVSDGRFAEIYSPFRPFTPEERARVEEQMQATYELFLSRVAQGRQVESAKIDAIAQGRVWTGHQARELGLVDELGGLDDAIRIAKTRARLDPAKDVDLVVYPPKRSFYEIVSNPFGATTGAASFNILPRPEARLAESALRMLRLFRRGEPLAVMPNIFLN